MVTITPNEQSWEVSVEREEIVDVAESCPRQAYLEARIPELASSVDALTITTLSRDQGWSDTHAVIGSYDHSFSWFEATIVTPTFHTRGGSRRFQVNRHGHPEPCRHVNRWTDDDADQSKRDWLAQIRGGDIIQVTPRAGTTVNTRLGASRPLTCLPRLQIVAEYCLWRQYHRHGSL